MMDSNFEEWFKTMFVPGVANKEKPCILLMDGHNSPPHLHNGASSSSEPDHIMLLASGHLSSTSATGRGLLCSFQNSMEERTQVMGPSDQVQASDKASLSNTSKKCIFKYD
jgi:hypothetical protein